jgi:hypothetical protein
MGFGRTNMIGIGWVLVIAAAVGLAVYIWLEHDLD